jgi:acetyl esterase/lipase
MKSRPSFVFSLLGFAFSMVQAAPTLPTPEALALWPQGVPGLRSDLPPEVNSNGGISVVTTPTLTPFVLPASDQPRPAVIVCPGGGYSHLAIEKEGFAIARWLNSLGISAFVLKYRLKEYGYPAPTRDGLQAMRLVRSRAEEWHLDPKRIGVIGFSAGGHLAASIATLFGAPDTQLGETPLSKVDARPDFAMLIYPVITMKGPLAHKGSVTSLLGASPAPELVDQLSLETRVTDKTPPTFLVHSSIDPTVPVQNSVQFYLALRNAKVPAEMHLYETGPHGFGLLPGHGPTSDWPKRAEEWLTARKIITPTK